MLISPFGLSLEVLRSAGGRECLLQFADSKEAATAVLLDGTEMGDRVLKVSLHPTNIIPLEDAKQIAASLAAFAASPLAANQAAALGPILPGHLPLTVPPPIPAVPTVLPLPATNPALLKPLVPLITPPLALPTVPFPAAPMGKPFCIFQ